MGTGLATISLTLHRDNYSENQEKIARIA